MSLPLVERIMLSHLLEGEVQQGHSVVLRVDRIYVQDGNAPSVARLFYEHRFSSISTPERIAVVIDHATLSPSAAFTNRIREAEEFARSLKIPLFRAGAGISHVIAREQGWYRPGDIVVGADSHTCTGGAEQCLGLGLGASDVVAAMVTGSIWAKVPRTRWIRTRGRPGRNAGAKDVMLMLLARVGLREFLYQSLEWCGEWPASIDEDSAATVANMTVETGAKCAFLPPRANGPAGMREIVPAYEKDVVELDLDGMPPFVAPPHSPANAVELNRCAGQPIDFVFVGSCTNGRLADLEETAAVLDHSPVDPRVHMVVAPGSRDVYVQALESGVIARLVKAGAVIAPPGCGPCVGTQGSVPGDGERVFTTMNRNFLGRMGNPRAAIWLGSPRVAAATAALGRIPREEDLP